MKNKKVWITLKGEVIEKKPEQSAKQCLCCKRIMPEENDSKYCYACIKKIDWIIAVKL